MTTGGIAILSTCGAILVAMIAGYVELRKARITQAKVVHEVQPNSGGSMRDAVDKNTAASAAIGVKLDKLADSVHAMDTRLTKVETRMELWLPEGVRRDGR